MRGNNLMILYVVTHVDKNIIDHTSFHESVLASESNRRNYLKSSETFARLWSDSFEKWLKLVCVGGVIIKKDYYHFASRFKSVVSFKYGFALNSHLTDTSRPYITSHRKKKKEKKDVRPTSDSSHYV